MLRNVFVRIVRFQGRLLAGLALDDLWRGLVQTCQTCLFLCLAAVIGCLVNAELCSIPLGENVMELISALKNGVIIILVIKLEFTCSFVINFADPVSFSNRKHGWLARPSVPSPVSGCCNWGPRCVC